GVLHRDIKPANILVTAYNRPALTDFGIASTTGAVSEAAGMSIPWSPPESFGDPPQSSARSDVYALAATLYSLLTGRSPFEKVGQRNSGADLISRIEAEPVPPLGRADVPESLVRALERGMAKNPADRFPSAVAFARALQKIQIELSHSVTAIDIVDDHQVEPDPDEDDDGLTRVREVVSIDPSPSATRPSAATRPVQAPTDPALPGPRFDPPAPTGSDVDATVVTPRADAMIEVPRARPADDDATRVRPAQVVDPEPAAAAVSAVPAAPATRSADSAPGFAATSASAPAPTERPAPAAVEPEPAPAAARPRRGALWAVLSVVAVLLLAGGSVLAVNLLNAQGPKPKPESSATADPQDPLADLAPVPKDVTGAADGAGAVHFTWTNPSAKEGDAYLVTVFTAAGEGTPTNVEAPEITVPAQPGGKTCIQVVLRRANGSASAGAKGCTP
ncbi:MAG: hypothetical protein B7X41_20330, partial [Microbacterium sp. 14-71-5]